MGNSEHMNIMKNSTVVEWNKWRQNNLKVQPDLTRMDLSGRNLSGIDFRGVGLFKVKFKKSILCNANLRQSIAIKADFSGCDLTGAHVYGISAWDIVTDESTKQLDLIITEPKRPHITVDNLQLAQFLHLLLNNKNIRDIIQTISSKAVLILGRFAGGHLDILRNIKNELRNSNYLPMLFDFENAGNRDLTETVITLASLSKFVICDLSYPASIPQEMYATIPNFPSVTFQPVIKKGLREYPMFERFLRYPWVNPVIEYESVDILITEIIRKLT